MPEHTPAPTPSRAVYGFALQLVFKVVFIVYLAWALLPSDTFAVLGITYLPQRYWALAIPMFLLTFLTIFAFIIYPSLGLYMNPKPEDITTVRDSFTSKHEYTKPAESKNARNVSCVCINKQKCVKHEFDLIDDEDFSKNCVPTLVDLNMADVSRHLYLK